MKLYASGEDYLEVVLILQNKHVISQKSFEHLRDACNAHKN